MECWCFDFALKDLLKVIVKGTHWTGNKTKKLSLSDSVKGLSVQRQLCNRLAATGLHLKSTTTPKSLHSTLIYLWLTAPPLSRPLDRRLTTLRKMNKGLSQSYFEIPPDFFRGNSSPSVQWNSIWEWKRKEREWRNRKRTKTMEKEVNLDG